MTPELLDEDGYPTEEALEIIRTWDYSKGYHELMKFIESIWWAADWGWRNKGNEVTTFGEKYSRTETVYDISTGGWSGNESIIYELEANYMFWSMCWYQSRRGGHYIFKVEINGQD